MREDQRPTFTVRVIAPGEEFGDAVTVRRVVFVEEQGFSPQGEPDHMDPLCWHVVFYDELGRPAATGRTYREAGDWHIGRVAVMRPFRGAGLGRELMLELERVIRDRGGDRALLGAQCRASGFYNSLGYTVCGEQYDDEGCPHVPMGKGLK